MNENDQALSNGLTVFIREHHQNPVAAFFIFYRVGARYEVPGLTGASHWVEHMMFKGTPKFGKGQLDKLVSKNGGYWNGFTSEDLTAYYAVLPAGRIELAVEIEADRMANCLFDPAEVASERTVIISEREGAENQPTFWLDEAVTEAAFKVHPYRHGVIGAKADLLSMTREDLYGYYRSHYSPANAVAVLVGDIDAARGRDLIEKHFGGVAGGRALPPLGAGEPAQTEERRVVVRRPGPTSYVLIAYHLPAAGHADMPAMMVLDAVLSGGKPPFSFSSRPMGCSSRLYRALVDGRLAAHADSRVGLAIDPGLFSISATARASAGAADIEKAITVEVERLRRETIPDDELGRAKKQVRAQLAYVREGVENEALLLGAAEVLGCPSLHDGLAEQVAAVTADAVRAVAEKYLGENNRTVGSFIPAQAADNTAGGHGGGARMFFHHEPRAYRELRPHPEPPSAGAALPGPETIRRRRLANGAVALAVNNPALPFALAKATLVLAPADEAQGRAGIEAICAEGVMRGNARRTFQEQSELTDANGMSLNAASDGETLSFSVTALNEDFSRGLAIMADAALAPAFPGNELDTVKGQFLTRIRERDSDTRRLAVRLFHEAAYPHGHPYHHPALGYQAEVQMLRPEAIRDYYGARLVPARLILTAVGGLDDESMLDAMQASFGGFAGPGFADAAPCPAPPPASRPAERVVIRYDLAGKTQSDIVLGLPGISRRDPDYDRLYMADLILGRMGLGGRLGGDIRDRQGLAYYVYTALRAKRGPGAWFIFAGVNPNAVDQAVDSMVGHLRRFATEPVSAEELADAKGYATGTLPINLETAEGLSRALIEMELFGLGLDHWQRLPDLYRAVTREDILAVATRCLDPERHIQVIVGPGCPGSGA
ncbi:MAG: M16 family metallopeptidase [Bacillota bacterium]